MPNLNNQRISNIVLAAVTAAFVAMGTATVAAEAAPEVTSALPAAAQQGDVQFLSGGVGLDESKAIQTAAAKWPLSLEFIGGERDFVSDVALVITDDKGGKILETSSQGPYMLVRLKPGSYTVQATYAGHEQKKQVKVAGNGHAKVRFNWKAQ
ncbi:MAG: carboxypeptidase regulatory-like domain-containing protein [Janthinobacterium lividum]